MRIELKKLSVNDDIDIYNMLQDIDETEFCFTNEIYGKDYLTYKEWLVKQYSWSMGKHLPAGYAPQTTYWLYIEGHPVGYGKIRHHLTSNLYDNGGNVGYAISKKYRGNGYGNVLLNELLKECNRLGVKKVLLTIMKDNYASIKVAEKNGGIQSEKDEKWYYYTFINSN